MSKLRAKTPEPVKKRLKFGMYGVAGVGKTRCAMEMPRPYIIDTEAGTEPYAEEIAARGSVVLHTCDMNEVIQEVRTLASERHDFKTLVIDSFTPLFEAEADAAADKVGDAFNKHLEYAGRSAKRLFRLLAMLDMNVVVTCHSKAKWKQVVGASGKKEPVQDGTTFDGWKKFDYLFDLIIEIQKQGRDTFFGVVTKTRYKEFPYLDRFEWSFDELANRYGREELERKTAAVQFADPESVKRLQTLMGTVLLPDDWLDKVLKKADADTIDELSREQVAACIEFCENRLAAASGGK